MVEWRNGVFGAEAASRHWFGKTARDLTAAEAALLASMLPAPRRAALAPAPRWLARARRILGLLERNGTVPAAEAPAARSELLERLLAAPPALPSDADEEPPEDG